MSRVCIIGLDCLEPSLVFSQFASELPHFSALAKHGLGVPLESTLPPITVPAWASMTSGYDPGQLGTYGFRDRANHSYSKRRFASSKTLAKPRLWDRLAEKNLTSYLIGVPQTWPVFPLQGQMVSGMLTPNKDVQFTYPAELRDEVERESGGYIIDAHGYRSDEKDALLETIQTMTRRRFKLARSWLQKDAWDFFMMVEMGPDRLHHGFWQFFAEEHPLFVKNSPWAEVILDYYRLLDEELGRILNVLKADDMLLIASDHGAQTMQGIFAINQWLVERGDLVLNKAFENEHKFAPEIVNWQKTRAFADGGFVGRIYLNQRGREAFGQVDAHDAEKFLSELSHDLAKECYPNGESLQIKTWRPKEIYQELRGTPPDLLIQVDDFAVRCAGTLGHSSLFKRENDTGPDGANHARNGVLIARDHKELQKEERKYSIMDIAPTVLAHFGFEIPEDMPGQRI